MPTHIGDLKAFGGDTTQLCHVVR